MAAENQNDSALPHLPAELRNEIYSLSLLKKSDFDDTQADLVDSRAHIEEPVLLLVSHQIRSEAFTIFYGSTFRSLTTAYAEELLARLSPAKRAALRDVRACTVRMIAPFSSNPWFRYMRSKLARVRDLGDRAILRPDAVKMPVKIYGEDENRVGVGG